MTEPGSDASTDALNADDYELTRGYRAHKAAERRAEEDRALATPPTPEQAGPSGEALRLYEFIAHGDAGHRAWLKAACEAFYAGLPRPEPDTPALASPGAMEGAQAAQPEPSPELIELVKAARELCEYGQGDNEMRAKLRHAGKAFYASVSLEWQRRFNGRPT